VVTEKGKAIVRFGDTSRIGWIYKYVLQLTVWWWLDLLRCETCSCRAGRWSLEIHLYL